MTDTRSDDRFGRRAVNPAGPQSVTRSPVARRWVGVVRPEHDWFATPAAFANRLGLLAAVEGDSDGEHPLPSQDLVRDAAFHFLGEDPLPNLTRFRPEPVQPEESPWDGVAGQVVLRLPLELAVLAETLLPERLLVHRAVLAILLELVVADWTPGDRVDPLHRDQNGDVVLVVGATVEVQPQSVLSFHRHEVASLIGSSADPRFRAGFIVLRHPKRCASSRRWKAVGDFLPIATTLALERSRHVQGALKAVDLHGRCTPTEFVTHQRFLLVWRGRWQGGLPILPPSDGLADPVSTSDREGIVVPVGTTPRDLQRRHRTLRLEFVEELGRFGVPSADPLLGTFGHGQVERVVRLVDRGNTALMRPAHRQIKQNTHLVGHAVPAAVGLVAGPVRTQHPPRVERVFVRELVRPLSDLVDLLRSTVDHHRVPRGVTVTDFVDELRRLFDVHLPLTVEDDAGLVLRKISEPLAHRIVGLTRIEVLQELLRTHGRSPIGSDEALPRGAVVRRLAEDCGDPSSEQCGQTVLLQVLPAARLQGFFRRATRLAQLHQELFEVNGGLDGLVVLSDQLPGTLELVFVRHRTNTPLSTLSLLVISPAMSLTRTRLKCLLSLKRFKSREIGRAHV